MSNVRIAHRNGVAPFDYLLILGIIMAPMTGLRLWKIGPSELLCAIWSTRYIRGFLGGDLSHYLRRFWLLFFLTITAGMLYCLIFYPSESSGVDGFVTWFFMMYISFGIYAGMKEHSLQGILQILETTCVLAVLWYFFLLVYSRQVSYTFMGAPLWYGRGARYTGGGKNPHQLAVLALGLFFVSFYFIIRVKLSWPKKLLHIACIGAELYFIRLTKSTTAWMALAATLFLGGLLLYVMLRKSVRSRQVSLVLLISFTALLLYVTFIQLIDRFMAWVALDPNGMGRFKLFADVVDPIRKNFLFGLGDGTHANFGRSEFHNSYLEIIGMSGLIGVVLFIVFTVRLIRNLWHDPFLLLIPFAYYIYGLSGFGLRRLSYWVMIVIMVALSERIPKKDGRGFLKRRLSRKPTDEVLLIE